MFSSVSSSVRLSFVALACAVGLAVPLAPTTSYAASAPAGVAAGAARAVMAPAWHGTPCAGP